MQDDRNDSQGEAAPLDSSAPQGTFTPKSSAEAAVLYDASYYQSHCGTEPYGRTPSWLGIFGVTADRLIEHLHPRTSLDAGCAFGLLVESLRDRGVDARGIDLSSFALTQVREDIRPYCRQGSVTEPLGGPYDLVTCIEVLEHLPPAEESLALERLCEAAPALLISSSPDDFEEATHFNVRPTRYWLERFAERGFYPDPAFDASFLAPQAVLFRKRPPSSDSILHAMDALVEVRQRLAKSTQVPFLLPKASGGDPQDPELLAFRLKVAEERIRVMESGIGWRILSAYRRWLQDSVRSRPWIARIYEPLANAVVRLAGGSTLQVTDENPEAAPHPVLSHAVHGGDLVLCCETPGADGESVAAGSVTVAGWAVAREGIRAIRIMGLPVPESRTITGLPSPDIAAYLPEYPDADKARFMLKASTRDWPEGTRKVVIEAESRSGKRSRIIRSVNIWNRTAYSLWIERREPQCNLSPAAVPGDGPLISIVTPLYRTPPHLLDKCVQSVERQSYSNWELCLVDDASGDDALRARLSVLAGNPRIKVKELAANLGIAGATNEALAMARGDYIAFLDHDDELAPNALAEVVLALSAENPPDVLYSDEDKITHDGERFDPFFKPAFSPELLHSLNYICHFLVVRASLLRDVGGLRLGFDGSQDYDLVLRLYERTQAFHRIPKILYHWRATQGSTAADREAKPRASENGRRALEEHLGKSHSGARATVEAPGRYRARYPLPQDAAVAIIIPTGGNMEMLARTVDSVLERTQHKPYRVIVADNSQANAVEDFVAARNHPLLTRRDFRGQPFNFSAICNEAAAACQEPLLLFLNDDMEVLAGGWLRAMAELGAQSAIGAVGAKLLYPDGSIQHAGITMGVRGIAGHAFRALPAKDHHYFGLPNIVRNCAAVTGACLLTRRDVFEAIGGFNATDFPVDFQDVEYCLKVWESGLRVAYTPYATLTHFESVSRGKAMSPGLERRMEIMRGRWGKWIENDPYYNPNLTRGADDFSLDPEEFRKTN